MLAEGVETVGELKFLSAESCDEAQGYLIGRPAPIEQFQHLTRGGDPPSSPSRGAGEVREKLRVVSQ